jgi:hypothetical protein
MLGYWPSNAVLALAGALNVLMVWQQRPDYDAGIVVLAALAYHHWQAHVAESHGGSGDYWRIGLALFWTVATCAAGILR